MVVLVMIQLRVYGIGIRGCVEGFKVSGLFVGKRSL